MPKEFKYDVVQLIRNVRERSCLWDKSLESYKDRVERRTAWEEVFNILEPRYEEMSLAEKKITGENILNKWTNIRDTFVKTLKTKFGKPKRKYILYNQLEFLIKVVPDNSKSDDADYSSTECADDPIILNPLPLKYEKDSEKETSPVTYNTRKRPKKRDSVEEIKEPKSKEYEYKSSDLDFVEVEEANDPRIMNEDEAFFASLLPSVVRYTEDERLEFRIEVLALMRRIKDNRKWAS
ncbi:uncharacterized protein [Epargyreus clarus]|uniref:uncharacterized protein n=1 Tax=Epargyreus clarus TaxID=520877 RepID=UPI003C2F9262